MAPTTLLLLEFNELCPSLLRTFMENGLTPNFRRFFQSSSVYTTDAEAAPPNLEPWIQWPTVHSGMPFSAHKLFHLGDGQQLPEKCFGELLSDAGIPVGVCGSMNLNYRQLLGYVLPDPWDKTGQASPAWLQPYYQTVSHLVQESSRESPCSKLDLARFAGFLLRHGLTFGTSCALARQLAHELRDPGVRWRRASLLDSIQYDLFRCLNRRLGVRMATFFCNSTAHFQHYYWRNWQPERFTVPPPATDHASLRDAIPFGYQRMDRLLGRIMKDYPSALLILCTALSQQPWTTTTKCTFRPRSVPSLLQFARVSVPAAVKPVMAEEFYLECDSIDAARTVEHRLGDLAIDDQPLMSVKREGTNLFTGCRFTSTALLDRPVTRRSDGATQPFNDLFYMIHTMRSGRHHPDGILWIRNHRHQVVRNKVPLTCIAPTILASFGVPQPSYMRGEPLPC